MKFKRFIFIAVLLAFSGAVVFAQTKPKPMPTPAPANLSDVKASAAYSEVLLRKTELSAELESLLVEYTEEFPRVRDIRAELGFLQKEIDRILAVKPLETNKLTVALGKLMVRKAEVETDLWKLQKDYNDDHPDVKSAKRKTQIFEAAIKEILMAK